ncbi:hypothetical protein HDU78_008768 [Chytriomyces hyalinus]|uniref:PRELI/MSF1 domain-containing protein n=1 Tax=Chytriomyces confervae TaxID=246404 RepID=A0A507FKN9_9FUNG|nr:hypothetical protein HDU78_008768 [Chytriomyces hyalinus]KAJ3249881.1 hypothetical protein HDU77_007298 [Chytriomyces hyalinus]KAJ3409603.1 hypothetical protein HDU80_011229 [Chytriomyces hyalinus]TPX76969.1 hypothetical protein CcCBS67573_g01769 [Chytriomyces confervae]
MVKLFESTHLFNYPWAEVTMAIWNKYPNPLAHHVLTADVIDRHVDPHTGILHTTRLFTKEGRLPKWARSIFHVKEAYILEVSELDPRNQTFKTVTRNISHAKLVLIEETQIVSPYVPAHEEEVIAIPAVDGSVASMMGVGHGVATAIRISARVISNTGWQTIRNRLEAFGASQIKENTLRSSKGLMHVIEELKRRKMAV